jgi:hypothetical protein
MQMRTNNVKALKCALRPTQSEAMRVSVKGKGGAIMADGRCLWTGVAGNLATPANVRCKAPAQSKPELDTFFFCSAHARDVKWYSNCVGIFFLYGDFLMGWDCANHEYFS